MAFKIAVGILLGFILLGVLCVVVAVISTAIVRAQDKLREKSVHVRIRPEADNYKRMQELKEKARTQHPEHWKGKAR